MVILRKPPWIRSKISHSRHSVHIAEVLDKYGLHTVCQKAACPNKGACWSENDITFLILGPHCTRNCRFCHVEDAVCLQQPAPDEPEKIARAIQALGLRYAVITSVTRDDLPDQGSRHFVQTVRAIKQRCSISVELLIPDFDGKEDLIQPVAHSGAEVIGHNMETVERLYNTARPQAAYAISLQTLELLKRAAPEFAVKSSLMVGLGETKAEIIQTAKHTREAGVDIFTIGQYLQPGKAHLPVQKYYTPQEFEELAHKAKDMGFHTVLTGPFVRSSYKARECYEEYKGKFEV